MISALRQHAINRPVRLILADGTKWEGKITEVSDDGAVQFAHVNTGTYFINHHHIVAFTVKMPGSLDG